MSDIFISYAKADHALALKLSAFLESEGWSVWWDKSLGAADLYRDEIMKQLAAARAVITIWTENSVRSDWVRAEAGRAKAEGKLIPVKTPELTYADIPLPFGEMHTENVGSTDLIRAAVVSLLSKPAAQQSPFWQVTNTLKYQILTWICSVGSAITLFANLNGVLDLADWARELVTHWHYWSQTFWRWSLSWIRIRVPLELVPTLTFMAFTLVLSLGTNVVWRRGKGLAVPEDTIRASFMKGSLHANSQVHWMVVGLLLLSPLLLWNTNFGFRGDKSELFIVAIFGFGVTVAGFQKEYRLLACIAYMLFMVISFCLILAPALRPETGIATMVQNPWPIVVALTYSWCGIILVSPLQQLTRRLGFVVLGVITLVVLSEISKLNLHQYLQPPKVSDNSVR